MLQLVEEALDQVALPIDEVVDRAFDFAVARGRDVRLATASLDNAQNSARATPWCCRALPICTGGATAWCWNRRVLPMALSLDIGLVSACLSKSRSRISAIAPCGSKRSMSKAPKSLPQPWHELLAQDRNKISTANFSAGRRRSSGEADPADFYQLFSSAGHTIGGMLTKLPSVPQPCWLYYFNVGDIGAAARHVNSGGGRMLQGPIELP